MPTAEILSQGDEVITGQTADTNAAWLSEQLTQIGIDVVRHTTVGDRIDDICHALRRATALADIVLCTGGLGPTDDDLTALSVAKTWDRPLLLDEEALQQIEAMYQRYNVPMPAVNRKQALLPTGCTRLDNRWGTAPGFSVVEDNTYLAFMPGVPREMKKMFAATVEPILEERFHLRPRRLVTLRTAGVGESTLQQRLGTIEDDRFIVSYRTKLPENHVKLRIHPDVSIEDTQAIVADLVTRIGSPVFAVEGLGSPGGTLAEVVGRTLLQADATLATAESCSGGQLSSMCTAVPGSSAWFLAGLVAYSDASKIQFLGVQAETLNRHGAVSEEVARELANGVRERVGSTYGLAATGIAGPSGATEDKPVGTVHIALSTPDDVYHRHFRLGGDRTRIQSLTAASCLDLLRRHLQQKL